MLHRRGAGRSGGRLAPREEMTVGLQSETLEAGIVPGAGSFACVQCDTPIVLNALDQLPACPRCEGALFRRASMFEHATPVEPATDEGFTEPVSSPLEWLAEIREELEAPGHFIAFQSQGGVKLLSLEEGWTRIGRSSAADIRLDDPTVSRRHALLVLQAGQVRVLDDRSLNGIFVNGEQVEWQALQDGDELAIGRYHLHFLEA